MKGRMSGFFSDSAAMRRIFCSGFCPLAFFRSGSVMATTRGMRARPVRILNQKGRRMETAASRPPLMEAMPVPMRANWLPLPSIEAYSVSRVNSFRES